MTSQFADQTIANLRTQLAKTRTQLADERRAYQHLSQRRAELADEVRAAETAAREYRDLLIDCENHGEIPDARSRQRHGLDQRHTAVIETYESCNYP